MNSLIKQCGWIEIKTKDIGLKLKESGFYFFNGTKFFDEKEKNSGKRIKKIL